MTEAIPLRVWVHVGSLMGWSGRPVGVLRVECEYARWLLTRRAGLNQEEVGFCRYDRETQRFLNVAPARVAARVVAVSGGDAQALARGAFRTADAVPEAASEHVEPATLAGPEPRGGEVDDWEVRFRAGDRLVSLGLDWETLDHRRLWALKQAGLRITLMCYDLIPVRFPQWFAGVQTREGFSAYLADLCWCADEVLCISRATRDDLLTFAREAGLPPPVTRVIRLGSVFAGRSGMALDKTTPSGAPELPPPGLPVSPAGQVPRPFVLCVGTIERRKNHEVLYRAMTRLRERATEPGCDDGTDAAPPHRMVFAGMRGWGVDDLMRDIELDPRTRDDIVVLHGVSDAELSWLYRHCAFTVYPSLYEGWGLPVAESLAHGRFCLCSSAPALREVGEYFCEYLDPWDVLTWAERLDALMRNPSQVRRREQVIADAYRPTPWSEAAQHIHAVVTADSSACAGQAGSGMSFWPVAG